MIFQNDGCEIQVETKYQIPIFSIVKVNREQYKQNQDENNKSFISLYYCNISIKVSVESENYFDMSVVEIEDNLTSTLIFYD